MNTLTTFINDPQVHGALIVIGLYLVAKTLPWLKTKAEGYVAKTTTKFDDEALAAIEKMVDDKIADISKTTTTTVTTAETK